MVLGTHGDGVRMQLREPVRQTGHDKVIIDIGHDTAAAASTR